LLLFPVERIAGNEQALRIGRGNALRTNACCKAPEASRDTSQPRIDRGADYVSGTVSAGCEHYDAHPLSQPPVAPLAQSPGSGDHSLDALTTIDRKDMAAHDDDGTTLREGRQIGYQPLPQLDVGDRTRWDMTPPELHDAVWHLVAEDAADGPPQWGRHSGAGKAGSSSRCSTFSREDPNDVDPARFSARGELEPRCSQHTPGLHRNIRNSGLDALRNGFWSDDGKIDAVVLGDLCALHENTLRVLRPDAAAPAKVADARQ